MLCGFREVSRFVKTTRIHLKQATYLHCTVEIGHFALYPVRLKSISDPFKNIRNETIYQCAYLGDDKLLVRYTSDGVAYWFPGHLFKSFCQPDVRHFPFDRQVRVYCISVYLFSNGTKYIVLNNFHHV